MGQEKTGLILTRINVNITYLYIVYTFADLIHHKFIPKVKLLSSNNETDFPWENEYKRKKDENNLIDQKNLANVESWDRRIDRQRAASPLMGAGAGDRGGWGGKRKELDKVMW